MELTGKITAKIHAHTFNGVPEDTEVTIFIPGMKHPIKGMLSDVEIEKAAQEVVSHLTVKPMTFAMPLDAAGIQPVGWFTSAWPKAKGGFSGAEALDLLRDAIPGLKDAQSPCPVCVVELTTPHVPNTADWRNNNIALIDIIIHLNDYHKWTREAVADWIETKDWDLQFVTPEETVA
jgi:hypothetical protein